MFVILTAIFASCSNVVSAPDAVAQGEMIVVLVNDWNEGDRSEFTIVNPYPAPDFQTAVSPDGRMYVVDPSSGFTGSLRIEVMLYDSTNRVRFRKWISVDVTDAGVKAKEPEQRIAVSRPASASFARTLNALDRNQLPIEAVTRRNPIYSRQAPWRSGDWTWPGDLRVHLTQSPHNVPSSWIATWSDRQCINYHNDLHSATPRYQRPLLFGRR